MKNPPTGQLTFFRALALASILFLANLQSSVAQECYECGYSDPCLYPEQWEPEIYAAYCPGPSGPPAAVTYCSAKEHLLQPNGCKVTTTQAPYAVGGQASVTVRGLPASNGSITLNKTLIVLPGFSVFAEDGAIQNTIDNLNAKWSVDPGAKNLLPDLAANGVDVLIVEYENGTDYIQNNGMTVVRLLQILDGMRGNGTPMTLAGGSMGGLVGRYALAYMERNNIPHNVGTYISLDSPHQGANIPLGAQYTPEFLASGFHNAKVNLDEVRRYASFYVPFLAGPFFDFVLGPVAPLLGDPILMRTAMNIYVGDQVDRRFYDLVSAPLDAASHAGSALVARLESPAARQLLINHVSNDGNDPLRTQFMTELDDLEFYPRKTRNVAFSNGSVSGAAYGISSGAEFLSFTAKDGATAAMNFSMSSQSPGGIVFTGSFSGPAVDWDWHIWGPELEINNVWYYSPVYRTASAGAIPLDAAPGSYVWTFADLAYSLNQSASELGTAVSRIGLHSFIPTYSALDLNLVNFGGQSNVNFLSLAGSKELLRRMTPFDEVYFPSVGSPNEQHLMMTAEKKGQLYNEVVSTHAPIVRPPVIYKPVLSSAAGGGNMKTISWTSGGALATYYEFEAAVGNSTAFTSRYVGAAQSFVLSMGAAQQYNTRVRACGVSSCSRYSTVLQVSNPRTCTGTCRK